MRIFLILAWLASSSVLAGEPYEIGREDIVSVAVLGHSELSGDFPVDREGILSFPMIGTVQAAGMTTEGLARKLTTLLADGYLKQPQVSASIKEYRSQKVFVSGEVKQPGPHPLQGNRSLRELLVTAGLLEEAGHEILVVRPPGGLGIVAPEESLDVGSDIPGYVAGAEIYRVHRRDLLAGRPEHDLVLEPSDSVFVPRAAEVNVSGHVRRPGAVRFRERLTVFDAIAAAGGIGERGSDGKIRIERLVDGQRQEHKAAMGDELLPGDTVIVGERFF